MIKLQSCKFQGIQSIYYQEFKSVDAIKNTELNIAIRPFKARDRGLITNVMKYFQLVLVLVLMALTTPLFYVQATKEISRSQSNKVIVAAINSNPNALALSPLAIQTSPATSANANNGNVTIEINASASSALSSTVSTSSQDDTAELTAAKLESRKEDLAKQIVKVQEELAKAQKKQEGLQIEFVTIEESQKLIELKKEDAKREYEKSLLPISSTPTIIKEVITEEPKAESAPEPIKNKTTPSNFNEAIDIACNNYGCSSGQMKRIMMCESTGNQYAQNGIYSGLFQFHPNTFKAYASKAGLSGLDIYNGYDQIQVAAYMFASGEARQWECK